MLKKLIYVFLFTCSLYAQTQQYPAPSGGGGGGAPTGPAGGKLSGTYPNPGLITAICDTTGFSGTDFLSIGAGPTCIDSTKALPSGVVVGTTDTQALTNKTVDGVTPTTFGFIDPTSSIQTQLNGKQASLGFTPLNAANNLSDVANTATSRTNLGLGSAATQSSTAFLLTSNNLSDIPNAVTARTNLGLGTAAVQNNSFFAQTSLNLSDLASASSARTNLGLGTAATQATSNVLPVLSQITTSKVNGAGVSTLTVAAPASIVNGNTLLIALKVDGRATITATFPAGFTKIAPAGNSLCSTAASNVCMAVATKTAASESGSYVVSWTGGTCSALCEVVMLNIPGVSGTADTTPTTATANAATITAATVTPVNTNGLLLEIFAQNGAGVPNWPIGALTQLVLQDSLTILAEPFNFGTSQAYVFGFTNGTGLSATSNDSAAISVVLPSTTVSSNPLMPVITSIQSPSREASAGDRAVTVGAANVVIDNTVSGTSGSTGLAMRTAGGFPVQVLGLNSANDPHEDIANVFSHFFVGGATKAGPQFITSSGRIGGITNDASEDVTVLGIDNDIVITSATAANPMVLTMVSAANFPAGMPITIFGAAGTGCAGMNATFTPTVVSGTSVTIPFNGTGCTYTASSGKTHGDSVHAGKPIFIDTSDGSNEIRNTYTDVGTGMAVGVTVNKVLIARTDVAGFNVISGHFGTQTATPSVGTCGTSPTLGTGATDNAGTINVGTGVVTACTLTFATTFTNVPACVVSDNSTAIASGINSISTMAVTFGTSASLGGGQLYYICQ